MTPAFAVGDLPIAGPRSTILGRPRAPEDTIVPIACMRCSQVISVQPGQRLPPWCPKCGSDLTETAFADVEPESPMVPQAVPQEKLADKIRERFTRHNFIMGAILAVWGLLIGLNGQPSNIDKLLHAEPIVAMIVAAIQWLTLANGGLLYYSGREVRAQRPTGASLAAVSAVMSIVGGIVYLGVFWYLGRFEGLENSAARVNFATSNLNLLVGLVDGVGLLVFLHRYWTPAVPTESTSESSDR